MHKRPLPMLRFVETPGEGGGTPPEGADGQGEAKTFTQDEVNALVGQARTDERRKATTKFADYDDLKARADGAKTLEQRMAEVEQRAKDAEARALRSDVAAKFGVSAEDRDLFLTGTDEESLTAQAKRLSERDSDRKKNSNIVPREGRNPTSKSDRADEREFVRELFGRANAE